MYALLKAPNGDFVSRVLVVGTYQTEDEAEDAIKKDAFESSVYLLDLYRDQDGHIRAFDEANDCAEWVVIEIN